MTPADRFWAKVVAGPECCWIWTASRDSSGYGTFRDGNTWSAHRWSWTQANGEIPEGMTIDHLCSVRRCVNPDHMEIVTQAENARRGNIKRTGIKFRPRDFCKSGRHDLRIEANVRNKKSGGRQCRPCLYEATNAWKRANRKRVA